MFVKALNVQEFVRFYDRRLSFVRKNKISMPGANKFVMRYKGLCERCYHPVNKQEPQTAFCDRCWNLYRKESETDECPVL